MFYLGQEKSQNTEKDGNTLNIQSVGSKNDKKISNSKHLKGHVHISVIDNSVEKSSITAIKDKIAPSSSTSMFCGIIEERESKRKRGRPTGSTPHNKRQNADFTLEKRSKTKMINNHVYRSMEDRYIHTEKSHSINASSFEANEISCCLPRAVSPKVKEGNSSPVKGHSIPKYEYDTKISASQSKETTHRYSKEEKGISDSRCKHQVHHKEQVYTN